jgi:hypothetical protein
MANNEVIIEDDNIKLTVKFGEHPIDAPITPSVLEFKYTSHRSNIAYLLAAIMEALKKKEA